MKFTKEQEIEIIGTQAILHFEAKSLLKEKAKINADCPGDGKTTNIKVEGANVTQLLLAASVARCLIGDNDTAHTVFISIMENYRNQMKDAPSHGNVEVTV